MNKLTLRICGLVFAISALTGLRLMAQPATVDKNKNRDPMIKAPGYVMPEHDQTEATVITIGDFDNFKLGTDAAECSIASNPNNPLQIYAVWNSFGTAGGKGYYTNDGYTWAAGNPSWTSMVGDVVVTYDSLGNLAFQNMYGSPSGVKVAMSTNNGQTWASPVVATPGSDKNWMAADQTAGPYSNYLYGSMTNSGSSGGNLSRSTDLGLTWNATQGQSYSAIPGTTLCIGPEGSIQGGAVYMIGNSGSSFNSVFKFYKSTDGGQTFTLKSSQSFTNTVGTQVGGRNAVLNMRTRPYPFVACDNSYGPHRGRLYLVYASNNPSGNGNKPDIFCRYSDDGGTTFSTAKVVNDDPNSQANHNWFPAVWCEKNTGRLYVSWYDTRDCPTSDSCMLYASYTDDGNTFAANQRISNKKMAINCNSCGGGGTPMYEGDYNGVTANKLGSMVAWTDFRDNTFGDYVAYFPDYGLQASPAIDTLSPVATIYMKVPSVKLFTDTVVVSASITGTAGLFNISYPQGNKLYTFPGELPVVVSGNGSVPLGDYTLTIVTTGSNGTPVHKRTAIVRALTPVPPVPDFVVNDTAACIGQALTFTDHSAGPPTSWQWSFPGATPSSSTAQNPTNIVYNTAGSYDVTLLVTNQAGSNTITKTSFVDVTAVPAAPVAPNVASCVGQPVPPLTATGNNLKWYKGTAVVGTGTSYNTGKTTAGVYSYSVTQTNVGCESPATAVTLTINSLPVVSFSTLDSVCASSPAFILTAGSPSGGLYSGTGVTSNRLSFDPAVAGPGNYNLQYVFIDGNGCSDSAYQTINVKSLPSVSLAPLSAMCVSAAADTLRGTPAGGTYSGTGVNGNLFVPSVAGAGTFTVAYQYVDAVSGCANTSSQQITVNALPVIALRDTSGCGNRTISLNATTADATAYLWTPGNKTTAVITVDTVGRGLGTFAYSIQVTDSKGCAATKSMNVHFFDCTGIEEPATAVALDLYPNPSGGQFTVSSSTLPNGTYSLRIYNTLNKLMYNEDNIQVRGEFSKLLNLKQLANGMYLLRLENLTAGWSKQFIINK